MSATTKGALQSKTILSGAVGGIASTLIILQQLNEAVVLLDPLVLALTTVVSSIFSIFGRIKATKKIDGLVK